MFSLSKLLRTVAINRTLREGRVAEDNREAHDCVSFPGHLLSFALSLYYPPALPYMVRMIDVCQLLGSIAD